MSGQKHQLTAEGKLKLEQELDQLKTVDRERNLEALKEARAQGDLSENADYDSARDEQARIESRIKEIEEILEDLVIIEDSNSDVVTLGTTIEIQYLESGETGIYSIVGTLEADPFNQKISNVSPVGKAVMGRHVGETVKVITVPGDELEVKIVRNITAEQKK